MIIDIVALPRRLAQFKHKDATINSMILFNFPISTLPRDFGYWDYSDEPCGEFGSIHRLILGTDALFRYKFIEPTKYGLAEYLVLSPSPIDVRFPLKNMRAKLTCPWVTITDPKTLITRKFIIWNGIFELNHFETEDNINDAPAELVLANEVKNLAKETSRPDILEAIKDIPDDWQKVLISEDRLTGQEAIDGLMQLGSNIKAYNELIVDNAPYYWCDVSDVFRGIDLDKFKSNLTVLSNCTLLSHFIYGSCVMKDIKHLFGMNYDAHAFQRWFNTDNMHPATELSVLNDNPDLFGVLKYVSSIPYSEFKITVNEKGLYDFQLYNQYDPYYRAPSNHDQIKLRDGNAREAVDSLKHGYPNAIYAEIVRSWEDCVYIIIKEADGNTHRYFFDLVSAALGARALIRDYDWHLF